MNLSYARIAQPSCLLSQLWLQANGFDQLISRVFPARHASKDAAAPLYFRHSFKIILCVLVDVKKQTGTTHRHANDTEADKLRCHKQLHCSISSAQNKCTKLLSTT